MAPEDPIKARIALTITPAERLIGGHSGVTVV